MAQIDIFSWRLLSGSVGFICVDKGNLDGQGSCDVLVHGVFACVRLNTKTDSLIIGQDFRCLLIEVHLSGKDLKRPDVRKCNNLI